MFLPDSFLFLSLMRRGELIIERGSDGQVPGFCVVGLFVLAVVMIEELEGEAEGQEGMRTWVVMGRDWDWDWDFLGFG
jgi:hypothetical protein